MSKEELSAKELYDQLEALEVSDHEEQAETMLSEIPQTLQKNSALSNIERNFHWIDFFYGNIIEFELENIIPALKAQFTDPEFQQTLVEKESLLQAKGKFIEQMAEKGKLTEDQYVQNLKGCLKAN